MMAKMSDGVQVDDMQNVALKEQGRLISALTERLAQVEAKVAEIGGQLSTFQNLGKAVLLMASAAFGIDVVQMGSDF